MNLEDFAEIGKTVWYGTCVLMFALLIGLIVPYWIYCARRVMDKTASRMHLLFVFVGSLIPWIIISWVIGTVLGWVIEAANRSQP